MIVSDSNTFLVSSDSEEIYSESGSKYYLILFLIWPLLALILAIINYKHKESQKVVFIFLIYYGLTIYFGDQGIDALGYVRRFENNASLPFSDFFEIIVGLYSNTSVDIVEPFISFVISRFTDKYRFLFAAYAALFGFFYLKSINLLYYRQEDRSGWNAIIFMIFFIIILPITSINGFRMWTAAWVFFYGAYHVVLYRDRRFILLALSASLVHWSFLTANVILIIYFFIGNCNFVYIPLVIVSFIFPNLLLPIFNSAAFGMGGVFQSRFEGYASEESVIFRQESLEQVSWFVTLRHDLLFYYLTFMLAFIFLFRRSLIQEKVEKNLFSFLLLFLAFVNFGRPIPSFGNRFQVLFYLFATLFVFLYYLKLPDKRLKLLTCIGLFPMALYAAVEFRFVTEVINTWTLLPVFGQPFLVQGIPLAELLFP